MVDLTADPAQGSSFAGFGGDTLAVAWIGRDDNQPVGLHAGKILGLMLAYSDNAGSELRENFVGSESVPEGPKDRGWIDAGLFGELKLMDTE